MDSEKTPLEISKELGIQNIIITLFLLYDFICSDWLNCRCSDRNISVPNSVWFYRTRANNQNLAERF